MAGQRSGNLVGANAEREGVVLVHGVWMPGWEMSLLWRRLDRCGYDARLFHYPSLRCTPAQSAQRLQQFLALLPHATLHLVAHSLGGIVLLHFFRRYPDQRPGRVVLLGTPARGSGVAARLHGLPVLRGVLGRSTDQGLLGGAPPWEGRRELGVIAGVLGIGVGRLIGGLGEPSDGTVALAETRIEGAADVLQVRASHTGLLFSGEVAAATCRFLREGRFSTARA